MLRLDSVLVALAFALLTGLGGCAGVEPAPAPSVGSQVVIEPTLVLDGDSFRARIDGREGEVRIWGIDAPEREQPGADAAREALRALIVDATLVGEVVVVDDYERMVARVRVGERDVGEALIAAGHAWWFRRYAGEHAAYRDAEAVARDARRGLWAAADPQAPWEFRAEQR